MTSLTEEDVFYLRAAREALQRQMTRCAVSAENDRILHAILGIESILRRAKVPGFQL